MVDIHHIGVCQTVKADLHVWATTVLSFSLDLRDNGCRSSTILRRYCAKQFINTYELKFWFWQLDLVLRLALILGLEVFE